MINYSKARESVQKSGSKKSLGRAPSNNKSHTSSINIKLSQDLSAYDHSKLPLRTALKCEPYLHPKPMPHSQHKKYSVKLQSNEKENHHRKKQQHYDFPIRPFQQTNRYLETERINKEHKHIHERTPSKNTLRLRTDYQNKQLKTEYEDIKPLRTGYTEATPDKMRKEHSTKHTTENSTKIVKLPEQDLRDLMNRLIKEQKEVQQLRKQLSFYRKHAHKDTSNSVITALKV